MHEHPKKLHPFRAGAVTELSRIILYLHDYNMSHKFRQPSPLQRLQSITAGKIRLCSGQSHEGGFAHGVYSRARKAAAAEVARASCPCEVMAKMAMPHAGRGSGTLPPQRARRPRHIPLAPPRSALHWGYERFACQTIELRILLKWKDLGQVSVPKPGPPGVIQTRQVSLAGDRFRHASSFIC